MPKNTGVGSLSLLQQSFPTQELNRDLHCRQILYQLSYHGSPLQEIPKKLFELNTIIAFTLQTRKLRLRKFLKPCPTCQLPCSCISSISTKIYLLSLHLIFHPLLFSLTISHHCRQPHINFIAIASVTLRRCNLILLVQRQKAEGR